MASNESASEIARPLSSSLDSPRAPSLLSAREDLIAALRKHWLIFVALLLGCAVAVNVAVDSTPRRATGSVDLVPVTHGLTEANGRLEQLLILLAQTEQAGIEKTGALRKASADLEDLLAIQSKAPKNKARNGAISKMRQEIAELVTAFAVSPLRIHVSDPGAPKAVLDRFNAELASYNASSPDREFVSDALARLTKLTALGEELRSIRSSRAAALIELARAQEETKKAMTNFGAQNGAQQGQKWSSLRSALICMLWTLTLFTSAAIVCGNIVEIRARWSIARAVAYVGDIARAVTYGRSRSRISERTLGHLRDLADPLDRMIDALQQAEARLQAAHKSLEFKVSARTTELWRANEALREESELRLRAERDFQQAQKMDALGKLAGSIAHDFNNILTVIIGGAEHVRRKIGAHHEAASILRTVEQAGERAAGLTRQMLTFSRNEVLSVEVVDLNEASNEAGRMLQRLLGVNIELRLDLAEDVRPMKANANQIQQVLINLSVNARDAMEGIGILTIATRNSQVDAEMARRHEVAEGDQWVELAVRDSGCGMDAATLARIFEPFFTTKPKGKGTGFGLATVFGIVKQSGGFIHVESALGNGTLFRVFFPAADPEIPANVCSATAEPETPSAGGHETLLLVDDEEDIRELATMTLEDNGYRVLSASNAEEAIVLAEKHASEIHALITDVVMPGMTGVQLATVLATIIPELNVLFVSGHSNETITEETLLATRGEYLQKPYIGKALLSKVQGLLRRGETKPATGK